MPAVRRFEVRFGPDEGQIPLVPAVATALWVPHRLRGRVSAPQPLYPRRAMAIASPPTDEALTTRPFTVDEVMQMCEVGIIGEDEHVELLWGQLVEVSPQGPPHITPVRSLVTRLARLYPEAYEISPAGPILATVDSLPEPDLAVVRVPEGGFRDRHARADECVLVIVVSVSSQRLDRRKAALYAIAGAPRYWNVDMPARRVLVYEEPRPDGTYALTRQVPIEDELILPEIEVPIRLSDYTAT